MKITASGAAGAIALLLSSVLAGCNAGHAESVAVEEPPAPLPVMVVSPEVRDIYATYQTTATIASDAEAPILARVAGEVIEILVEEGDTVTQGQVLARLDGDRLRLEMQRARAEYERASREYERTMNLHERNLVSTAAFEGLLFDRDMAKASYELKRLEYEYTAIRATIPGVVSAREVKVGTNVATGEEVFRITDTAELVAYLNIPQTELSKFAAGHRVIVAVDSAPGEEFGATVARISPTIDTSSGTFRATVFVDNDAGELAPGMFGRFTIAYEKHADAIVIPASAAVREDNELIVYVVEDGSAVRRPIRPGILSDGLLEVVGGLDAHDSIVLSGQSRLRDGSRVLASAVSGKRNTSS